MFDLTLAQILRYFLNFRKCAYESLLPHRNILRKCEKLFYEVFADQMHLFIKDSIFHNVWPNFGPDFEIFSQFQEMRLWITFLHCNILRKSIKQFWGYAGQMQLFIKDSIFHNVWPNFGPRFWDIFSISGNALMNHFFRKSEKRFWGYADPMHLFIKHSIFHNVWPNLGPRLWDIFSISGNALMNLFFSIAISCEKAKNISVRFSGSDAPFH